MHHFGDSSLEGIPMSNIFKPTISTGTRNLSTWIDVFSLRSYLCVNISDSLGVKDILVSVILPTNEEATGPVYKYASFYASIEIVSESIQNVYRPGIGSITNGLINQSNGESHHAGWAGGQLSGALSFIPYFGGGVGAFAGSALTDLIDAKYNISSIDWEKAAYSGLIAFGLSWFDNTVKWGGDELDKVAQFALSYDYALLGISNSIINVFWRGRKKW